MTRYLERKRAFEILFAKDLLQDFTIDEGSKNIKSSFTKDLVCGVLLNLEKIDAMLAPFLKEGWSLKRLVAIDRTLLRLAVYELFFFEEKKSCAIVINEIVELAKKYSSTDSSKYINGILGQMVKNISG